MRLLFIVVTSLLIACNSEDRKPFSEEISVSSHESGYSFHLSPVINKEYFYDITNTTEIIQEMNDEKVENNNSLEIAVAYTFTRDTSNSFIANLQYKKFRLLINSMGNEYELDADGEVDAYNPSKRMFSAFKNARIQSTLDSQGNVSAIKGVKEIQDKMKQLAEGDKDALQMLNTSIKQYVSESFFKQSVEQNFKYFTSRSLKIGDTISNTASVNAGIDVNMKTVYKLVSIKNNIASIDLMGKVDLEDHPVTVEGRTVYATLEGKQSGIILIDIITGMIQRSSSEFKAKGVLKFMKTEIPLKFKMSNSIKLKT